jgi:hypothetical protein
MGSPRLWPRDLPWGAGWPPRPVVRPRGSPPDRPSAWVRRTESPEVWQTWSWCGSRSTVAVEPLHRPHPVWPLTPHEGQHRLEAGDVGADPAGGQTAAVRCQRPRSWPRTCARSSDDHSARVRPPRSSRQSVPDTREQRYRPPRALRTAQPPRHQQPVDLERVSYQQQRCLQAPSDALRPRCLGRAAARLEHGHAADAEPRPQTILLTSGSAVVLDDAVPPPRGRPSRRSIPR